ncbi:hypothetical protein QA601_18495 [Chitinispirillales bacterium ANBcel5]|uniref:hypothetical protein n=1 Tax=Cellulosispirillum alkaliphilum TaxID=3039283 RepID=UPI002A559350|nr:hypothetical protein [Chitinispirillales bacterium ANBcel5]
MFKKTTLYIQVLVITVVFSCNATKESQYIKNESVTSNKDSNERIEKSSTKNDDSLPNCEFTQFDYSDSTGVLRGLLVSTSYTTRSKTAGIIRIVDIENDTIDFSFDVSNIEPNLFHEFSCVEIEYGSEIFRVSSEHSEDGPVGYEISRRFFIKKLKID